MLRGKACPLVTPIDTSTAPSPLCQTKRCIQLMANIFHAWLVGTITIFSAVAFDSLSLRLDAPPVTSVENYSMCVRGAFGSSGMMFEFLGTSRNVKQNNPSQLCRPLVLDGKRQRVRETLSKTVKARLTIYCPRREIQCW